MSVERINEDGIGTRRTRPYYCAVEGIRFLMSIYDTCEGSKSHSVRFSDCVTPQAKEMLSYAVIKCFVQLRALSKDRGLMVKSLISANNLARILFGVWWKDYGGSSKRVDEKRTKTLPTVARS